MSQRQRLNNTQAFPNSSGPSAGRYAVPVHHEPVPPDDWYGAHSFTATQRISKKLLDDELFSAQIRRIAYLETVPKNATLVFHAKFAYGEGV